MKNNKVFLLSAIACAALGTVGCSHQESKIDTSKTQLYVQLYTNNLSLYPTAYYGAKTDFEERYKDVSFEEGKKGVEVVYHMNDLINPDTFNDGIDEVYWNTTRNPLELNKRGLLMDISELYSKPLNYDFVTQKTNDNDTTDTLENLMRANRKETVKGNDGKYYGVPCVSDYYGLVYDIDLFNEKNYWFAENGTDFVTSATDKKSAGPDGEFGTYDDGCPATFDDFYKLCTKIAADGYYPMTWSQQTDSYVADLQMSMGANESGIEEYQLNYNFDGTAKTLLKMEGGKIAKDDAGNPIIDSELKIVPQNGYELKRQKCNLTSLQFIKHIIENNWMNPDTENNAFSYKDAQEQFLLGKRYKELGVTNRKRAAMIVEGSWWVSEASGTFAAMEEKFGEADSKKNRNFGMLPLPKSTQDKVGEPWTLLERATGDGFVTKQIADFKKPLALSFLQSLYTHKSMLRFAKDAGAILPVKFTLSDEEYNSLDGWGKRAYDLQTNAQFAMQHAKGIMFETHPSYLWYSGMLWKATVNGEKYTFPSEAFVNHPEISAEDYFEGLSAFWTQEKWNAVFKGTW